MRAARLLADREHDADPDGCSQQPAGEARLPGAQGEVEGDQRESGRGMGTRVAAAGGLVRGALGEQRRVGPVAAVVRQVARAVHAGHLLEAADQRRAEGEREHHVSRLRAPGPQPLPAETCGPERERREPDDPHEQRAAGVYHVHGPPARRADPGGGRAIEEQGIGDAPVEV